MIERPMSRTLLSVEHLTTFIGRGPGAVRAVDDVSLRVDAGEAVALVGESGSGKTMTARSLIRLLPSGGRTLEGSVLLEGDELLQLGAEDLRRARGRRVAMVFQDPSTFLNPLMTIGDQVEETILAHELIGRRGARARALEALERVRLPRPGELYKEFPHRLSGGMRQRVLIAIAISCRPKLLIADEPTTALDVTTQAQIMSLLTELRHDLGLGLLLITHDLGLVSQYCDRLYVMYAGRIVESAPVAVALRAPVHPYTEALLKATATIEGQRKFDPIGGQPPSLAPPPPGCRFHPRCPLVMARCLVDEPDLFSIAADRSARCWLAPERAQV
jgi:oligopeptide/dipeptide ABC transporter ATP-binding protein